MSGLISVEDEAKLLDLRYGLADLISTCRTLSPDCLDDAVGLANLLQAADTQIGLLLHLRNVQVASRRATTGLFAAA